VPVARPERNRPRRSRKPTVNQRMTRNVLAWTGLCRFGRTENQPTLARGVPKTQPIASIGDCCAMLIQNLSSERPQQVMGGAVSEGA
ncbi:MAG: hypothetical protein LBB25_02175, partial [Holosporaceae bacterium]|nr:hypothetical protein [Holosporaceae bacterium]